MDRIDVISVLAFAALHLHCQMAKMPTHRNGGQRVGRAIGDALCPDGRRVAHPHFHEAARNTAVWMESRRVVPFLPAVVVMFNSPQQRWESSKCREAIVAPNAGQFAREAGVLHLRDDEPVAMIIAADQGMFPP